MLSTSISIERVTDRRIKSTPVDREVVTFGSVVEETTNYNPMNTTAEYIAGILAFTEKLGKAKLQAFREQGERVEKIEAMVENGRKFDKIFLTIFRKERKSEGGFHLVPERGEALYFVDRKDGAIYGVKSPVSPNLKHYYGTLDSIDKWNWAGDRAEPIDLDAAGVVAVSGYGDFVHYVPVIPEPVEV